VRLRLKHIHRFKDRHGRIRHYLRMPGVAAVGLPGEPGDPAFMAAYNESVAAYAPPERSQSRARPGSMRDLAERYYATSRFKTKAPRTRYVERQILERFLFKHADKAAASVQTRHLDAIFSEMSDRPAAAMDLRKRLRNLFRLAIKLGWRLDDPIAATDTFKGGSHHTWTEKQIAAFQLCHPRGSMRRLAFDLLLYTGQRSGDIRAMRWVDFENGRFIVVAQQKTGQAVSAPLHAELVSTLACAERSQLFIVTTKWGAPFTTAGFGNWMADSIAQAGLPDECVAHGLRKAAARRLAEAGCTPHEIKAITGHKSLKEVQRYTEASDRMILADSAMSRVAAHDVNKALANQIRKPEKRRYGSDS
jgi:integrase